MDALCPQAALGVAYEVSWLLFSFETDFETCDVKLSGVVTESVLNSPMCLGRVWKSILIFMLCFKGEREMDFLH